MNKFWQLLLATCIFGYGGMSVQGVAHVEDTDLKSVFAEAEEEKKKVEVNVPQKGERAPVKRETPALVKRLMGQDNATPGEFLGFLLAKTQQQTKSVMQEFQRLKEENEKLRAENERLKKEKATPEEAEPARERTVAELVDRLMEINEEEKSADEKQRGQLRTEEWNIEEEIDFDGVEEWAERMQSEAEKQNKIPENVVDQVKEHVRNVLLFSWEVARRRMNPKTQMPEGITRAAYEAFDKLSGFVQAAKNKIKTDDAQKANVERLYEAVNTIAITFRNFSESDGGVINMTADSFCSRMKDAVVEIFELFGEPLEIREETPVPPKKKWYQRFRR